jgi:hypothetical protein
MVSRIIYNGGRVSNMHLWVTIAFYELPRGRSNARQLLQLETLCPSLKNQGAGEPLLLIMGLSYPSYMVCSRLTFKM